MTISQVKQNIQTVVSKVQTVFKSPAVVKVQIVAFDALNLLVSTLAGVTGFAVGIVGGAVLVCLGSVIGIGSLALHLINLYGMCLKDGSEACYSTVYSYLKRFRPVMADAPVKVASA
jgi:hypothetical protein